MCCESSRECWVLMGSVRMFRSCVWGNPIATIAAFNSKTANHEMIDTTRTPKAIAIGRCRRSWSESHWRMFVTAASRIYHEDLFTTIKTIAFHPVGSMDRSFVSLIFASRCETDNNSDAVAATTTTTAITSSVIACNNINTNECFL